MPTDRHQNFRLRGIPRECETRLDVRELIKRILSIEAGASVIVYSLAISPVEQNSKVATLSFHTLPDSLSSRSSSSGRSGSEWVFNLPVEDAADEDCFSPRKLLVFDTHFSGFTPLQHTKDDDCYVDVIAIAGLGGHAFGSFKEKNGPFMWLRDALPLDVPGARILIYGYNTRISESSSFQNLTDLGRALQIDIKVIREFSKSRPIIFIGHSLGGLVIKEAIVNLKEDLDGNSASLLNSISGFLFFGVPHQGMAIESLVPLVKDNPNRGLLESLEKHSALLQRLGKEFSSTFSAKRLQLVSFYETEKSPTAVRTEDGKWQLSGPFEVLVDVSSATYGTKRQYPIDRNHSEMVKYSSQYDEIYQRVLIALREFFNKSQSKSNVGGAEARSSSSVTLSERNLECLRSLSFKEEYSRHSQIYSAKGTCEWLLKDSQYQVWMSKPRGLFWIKGNPGAGKSVLMKFAVTMMNRRKSGDLVLSFFIHGRGMLLQKTPLGIFRALLHSMLESFPEYLSQLTEQFNERERLFGAYKENRWDWPEQELQDFTSKVLTMGTKNQPVIIFVDALDECGKYYATSLLTYFKDLMSDIEREEAQVKICFSSRHYPILGLDTIPKIFVEERNEKDIRLFVQERLYEIQPDAKREQIEKDILLKAHGGFQWAVLITDAIIDGDAIGIKAEKLHEMLTTTPEVLDELYATILSSATEAEKRRMTKLFLWILFSERPLSAHELREALATDKDMTCTTVSEIRRHESWTDTLAGFERHVRHISRGLVEFQTREIWEQYEPGGEDSDREAQFVHQSVADYLLGKFLKQVEYEHASQSLLGAGHFEISRSCLKYLMLREVLEGVRMSRGSLSAKFPLLPYVVQYVFHHIREVERAGIPQLDLLSIIRWDRQSELLKKIASVWRVMNPHNVQTPMGWPFVGATPLHILVALGSKSAVGALLQKDDVQVDGRDSHENTPLLLAVTERHQEIALVLLNRLIKWQHQHNVIGQSITENENIEQRTSFFVDVNAENNDGETALTIALTENAGEVIFKLIEAGADLEFFGQQTALVFYAIRNKDEALLLKLLEKKVELDGAVYVALKELSIKGSDRVLEKFVEKLLKAGANTLKTSEVNQSFEGDDDEEDEAILLASRTGQRSMVILLLSHGTSTTLRDKHGSTPLLLALKNGHEGVAEVLVRYGADVNARDNDGLTPLLWVSECGYAVAARFLVENGADVNASDEDGLTPLSLALKNSHKGVAEFLIGNKADVNASDGYGLTPLLWASEYGHAVAARLLIKNGADINISDEDGLTPLLLALKNSHIMVAEVLVGNKADVNARDKNGLTPLLWALEYGYAVAARFLVENGADIHASDEDGLTPLLLALKNSHKEVAEVLVRYGADVNARDNDGFTPLLWASEYGHAVVARFLVENGVDIHASDKDGLTPLLLALKNSHIKVAEVLVGNKADVNARNKNGLTPLLWASEYGYAVAARFLIENGADINTNHKDGSTPLLLALRNGHEGVAEVLIGNRADVNARDNSGLTPLLWASEHGRAEAARLLIENGADINTSDKNMATPLSWASRHGHVDAVRVLIENGADINTSDEASLAPLSWASWYGHVDAVRVLIEKGADINTSDEAGLTPLSWASRYGHAPVVRVLIENGADVNISDKNMATPLSWASRCGHVDAVSVLIENGVDINTSDEAGLTPLSWALQYDHAPVVSVLTKNGAGVNISDEAGLTPPHWVLRCRHAIVPTVLIVNGADILAPLFWASWNGYQGLVNVLMDKKADINARDDNNLLSLSWASWNGYESVVRALIKNGADVNARDNNGLTPLWLALWSRYNGVVEILLENKADVNAKDNYGSTPLLWASQNSRERVVKVLIENKADVNTSNKKGLTPLLLASQNGHVGVVKILIESRADINAKDNYGLTPLLLALHNGHKRVIEVLIENGADVDARDNHGLTPLFWASRNGYTEAVKILIENGADINTRDNSGSTSLFWASWSGHQEVVKVLIENKVDINAKDNYKLTSLFWAWWNSHEGVVRVLIENGADINDNDKEGLAPSLCATLENSRGVMVRDLVAEWSGRQRHQQAWVGTTFLGLGKQSLTDGKRSN